MTLRDYIHSVRNTIFANVSRSFLTLLGIMIGAGSIVLLAGLLRSGKTSLSARAQNASEANIVTIKATSSPQKDVHRVQKPLSRSDEKHLGQSRLLSGAKFVSESTKEYLALWRGRKKRVRLVGTSPEVAAVYQLEVSQGRFLTRDDLAVRRRVCVVGYEVWQELLAKQVGLGGIHLTIDDDVWSVVGVLKDKPFMGATMGTWIWNRKVLVPETTYDAMYQPSGDVERVFVRLSDSEFLAERLSAVTGIVQDLFLRRHYGVKNFKAETPSDDTGQLIGLIVVVLLFCTTLLSLFVGGINIMNIMLVTVSERTREIGIRRAVGAPPRAILLQFLLESMAFSLVGGILGIIGGAVLLGIASLILKGVLGAWSFQLVPWSVAAGFGLSLVTGIVFGLFPAWRAAKLDPVEALRSV